MVLLSPVVAGTVAAVASPKFVETSQSAEAIVDTYPVAGTHVAYEVATYVADFDVALKSPDAVRAAAEASGTDPSLAGVALQAAREGDSARVRIGYQAKTTEQAKAGLVAAAATALASVAESDMERAEITVDAAGNELTAALAAVKQPYPRDATTAQARAGWDKYRADRVAAASAALNEANLEVASAKATVEYVPEFTDSIVVQTEEVDTTSDVVRIVLTAAVSSMVIAVVVVLLVRRFVRRRSEDQPVEQRPAEAASADDAPKTSQGPDGA